MKIFRTFALLAAIMFCVALFLPERASAGQFMDTDNVLQIDAAAVIDTQGAYLTAERLDTAAGRIYRQHVQRRHRDGPESNYEGYIGDVAVPPNESAITNRGFNGFANCRAREKV